MKDKKKGLNLIDFFMLGFGSMVGVGWSVAVNGWFGSGGGPIATFLAFGIGTLLMIPIGFCYAELTTSMPVAGGVVAFSYKAFGTFPSFLGGWFVALAYVTVLPWEAIYINDVLALIFPALKSGEPLYSIAGVGIYPQGLAVGVVLSFALIIINWVGTRIAGRVQTYLTILLAITGFLVIVFAFLKADPSNMQPIYENVGKGTHTSFLTGIIAMMVVAPFFLAGFDTIPQAAEEGDSKVNVGNIGKVLVGSILAAGSFYCLIILSTGMAMPWTEFYEFERPATSLLFLHLYPGSLGAVLYWVSLVGALAGLLTTWNGLYIASARLLVGMGRARLIPQFFTTIHPKYGTPKGANTFCAVACLIGPFVGMGIIDPLTIIGSTAFVIGWFVTSASAIKLRSSAPDMLRPYQVPGGRPVMWIAAIVSAIIILLSFVPVLPSYMGNLAISIFIIWILLGLGFYFGTSRFRGAISEEERVKAIFQSKLLK